MVPRRGAPILILLPLRLCTILQNAFASPAFSAAFKLAMRSRESLIKVWMSSLNSPSMTSRSSASASSSRCGLFFIPPPVLVLVMTETPPDLMKFQTSANHKQFQHNCLDYEKQEISTTVSATEAPAPRNFWLLLANRPQRTPSDFESRTRCRCLHK